MAERFVFNLDDGREEIWDIEKISLPGNFEPTDGGYKFINDRRQPSLEYRVQSVDTFTLTQTGYDGNPIVAELTSFDSVYVCREDDELYVFMDEDSLDYDSVVFISHDADRLSQYLNIDKVFNEIYVAADDVVPFYVEDVVLSGHIVE